MPRSWYQIGRDLIQDLKETFRIGFKQVQSYPLPLGIQSHAVDYRFQFLPEAYGGLLFADTVASYAIDFSFNPQIYQQAAHITARVLGSECLIHQPAVTVMETLAATHCPIYCVGMLPRQARIDQYRVERLAPPKIQKYSSAELTFSRLKQPSLLPIGTFRKPVTFKISSIQPQSARFNIDKKALPIQKAPIPPHRFSSENRGIFRDALARKANLPAIDVQLVGIYDRLSLGLFQSLSQTPEGLLLCVPKSIHTLTTADTTPVYLVIGKSFKLPGKSLQAVVPAGELILKRET